MRRRVEKDRSVKVSKYEHLFDAVVEERLAEALVELLAAVYCLLLELAEALLFYLCLF